MTDFEQDVINRLSRIETMLANDGKILYGNHQPGLVAKVSTLESDMAIIKARRSWVKDWLGWICAAGISAKEVVQLIIGHGGN